MGYNPIISIVNYTAMGYCGGKITGHTGTEFKHKNIFTKSRGLLNHKSQIENLKIESREQKRGFSGFDIMQNTIAFLFIIVLIIITSMLIYRVDEISVQKEKISIDLTTLYEEEQINSENRFLDNLYIKAENEFNNGRYTRAHEKLYALLLVEENNNLAEKLLIKVLIAKCEKFNIGCQQLEYYAKHLEKKHAQNILN